MFSGRFLSTALLIAFTTGAFAQQQSTAQDFSANHCVKGIVADMLTRIPQREVMIYLNTNKTVTTPWDGTFCIDDSLFTSATIVRSGYVTRKMNREEFGDTIFLIPTEGLLNEVVVVGRRPDRSGLFSKINSVDAALIRNGQQQGFNPLGLLAYIVDKLGVLPEKGAKARRKKEKQKAIIDNY